MPQMRIYTDGFIRTGSLSPLEVGEIYLNPTTPGEIQILEGSCNFCPTEHCIKVTQCPDGIHRELIIEVWEDFGPESEPVPLMQAAMKYHVPTDMVNFREKEYGHHFGPPGSVRQLWEHTVYIEQLRYEGRTFQADQGFDLLEESEEILTGEYKPWRARWVIERTEEMAQSLTRAAQNATNIIGGIFQVFELHFRHHFG